MTSSGAPVREHLMQQNRGTPSRRSRRSASADKCGPRSCRFSSCRHVPDPSDGVDDGCLTPTPGIESTERTNLPFCNGSVTMAMIVQSGVSGVLMTGGLRRLNHLIRRPREIYVQEGPKGVETVAVVSADGMKQILHLRDPLMLPALNATSLDPAR